MTQTSNPVQRFRCMVPMAGRPWPGVEWQDEGESRVWHISPVAHCIVDDVQLSDGLELVALFVDTVPVSTERLRQLTLCPPPQRPRRLSVHAKGAAEKPVLTLLVRSGLGAPFVGAMLIPDPNAPPPAPAKAAAPAPVTKSEPPVSCQMCGELVVHAEWPRHRAEHVSGKREILPTVDAFMRHPTPETPLPAAAPSPAPEPPPADVSSEMPDWLAAELAAEGRSRP